MNPDVNGDDANGDPIGRHLEARARTIDLPRTDVGTIAERATRRRQRRHRVTFGVAGVTLLAGTSFAVLLAGGGDDRTPVATTSDAVVASPLDWTLVDPVAGLGYTRGAVITADGAVYSLSTAPGPAAFNDPAAFANRTLYRSTDGTEWDTLDLPDDLFASSLAAEGSRLYAVGTGPTGGEGVPLRIATSDDGGATWSATTELPGEISGLKERFGSEVIISPPVVAAHAGSTLVAVTVTAYPDVAARAPGGINTDFGWASGPDGVQIFGEPACAAARGGCVGEIEPPVIANLTWEQLDLPDELHDLLTPRRYLYLATPDGAFEPVPGPGGEAVGTQVVGGPDGFTLLSAGGLVDPSGRSGEMAPTRRFDSPDGRSWTENAPIPGVTVDRVGAAGDQMILTGWKQDGRNVIGILQPDGFDVIDPLGFTTVDAPELTAVSAVGFGPLGWAALIIDESGNDGPTYQLVHSNRGSGSVSVVPLPEELAPYGAPTGVTVTADAIVARFTEYGDGNPATQEAQRLWVGTPTG